MFLSVAFGGGGVEGELSREHLHCVSNIKAAASKH
jgi:hypothetical protein